LWGRKLTSGFALMELVKTARTVARRMEVYMIGEIQL
jgi:hypothetical protein